MTTSWESFVGLPGAVTTNFEKLCRAIIHRHYGRFGEFVALANQPGIEFHLRLHSPCSLGEAGRWYGWQCRWYDLPSGRAIGTTRRKKIKEALDITEAVLPNLTDWVLWTRHPLTAGDQRWFRSLPTHMRLHLWSAAEVEEHLSGSAEILRGTYFGELILTPELLGERHETMVARVKRRWQPEVHQVMDAERSIHRQLGAVDAWAHLHVLGGRLEADLAALAAAAYDLPTYLVAGTTGFVEVARALAASLVETHAALGRGDYETLRQHLANLSAPGPEWGMLLRRLRSARSPAALVATNVLADMYGGHKALTALQDALTGCLVAVVADAGCGKTELSAQLTAPTDVRPAGVLFFGADLHSGHTLDDLARSVIIHGRPVPSFEALIAAVDAAGQRAGRRLPIVIDGLNEAEDPRIWKGQLSSLRVTLQRYPYVLVICTLRSPFAEETLPEEVDRLEMPGFEEDTMDAVRRYFRHYRINPADAELPWGLLQHPLTLRMFCEVTNPDHSRIVGVEAMPGSLTALFDRYLEQVAERITELAPRTRRYYESDVRTALSEVGLALWEENARSLDIAGLRRRLGDEARPWDASIVRFLEHDGVLLRVPADRPSAGHVTIVYDALAGHLIADALLDQFGGREFTAWMRKPATAMALSGGIGERHPLATDISRSLVGLTPRRMHRRQLWPLLDEPLRTEALFEAAWLEGVYLDQETVTQLASLVGQAPASGQRDLLARLRTTRAARPHPLNAEFLDEVLRAMPLAERDLRWTEWIRRNREEIIKDLQRLEQRWRTRGALDRSELLRAQWAMWTLTSTDRILRDHATRALYWFGSADPEAFFGLTVNALAVNDPYVPERMLAACYGVAMGLWADPRGTKLRDTLPGLANELVGRMFLPDAPHPTRHALMRDYALGLISLATRVASGCVPKDKMRFLEPPFDHSPSPFTPAAEINDSDVVGAKDAIGMDFGNYTIGRLIPSRGNYDFKNPTYRDVRRQIEKRIVDLGYSPARFAGIDQRIGSDSWRAESQRSPKIDRYGKKYSWIAYFEMYGLRHDKGTLPEWRAGERSSDIDIDPSFPELGRTWHPLLPDPFANSPTEPPAWIANGATPNYDHLLFIENVDGQRGPWVLLNGYIEQTSGGDGRHVFSFLRGLLVKKRRVKEVINWFDGIEYPGNHAIPEPREECYTFAGEIPWSARFGSDLRGSDGKPKRDTQKAFRVFDGIRWLPGIPVEVPVSYFGWESYHSALNQVSGIMVPAPALCDQLNLSNRQGEWDLYDSSSRLGTIYREFKSDEDTFSSKLLYLRADLMAEYLREADKTLVWLVWGERELEYQVAEALRDKLQKLWWEHKHIHRHWSHWEP